MGFGRLWKRLKDWDKRARDQYSHDILDPAQRLQSRKYTRWIDHEILRVHWHNFAEIAPGVFRSNHPTHLRLQDGANRGFKTILNLRGATKHAPYRFEVESCEQLGLRLVDIPLSARTAPPKDRLLERVDLLPTLEKPFLMHCKSGADRTGLVAAVYLLTIEGRPVEEAKKQLSFRFMHLTFTKTGILDYVIWRYEQRLKDGAIGFREWVVMEYEPADMAAGFARMGFWDRVRM